MSDVELADILDVSLHGLRELIAQNEAHVAKLGRVEMANDAYQLDRRQALYLASSLNVYLGQMASAGVEEAFSDKGTSYLSDADLAEVIGVTDLQGFRGLIAENMANGAKLGCVERRKAAFHFDKPQSLALIAALSLQLGRASVTAVKEAFADCASSAARADDWSMPSVALH